MSFRAALKRKKVATSATRYEHTIPFTPAGAVSDLNAPVNAAMTRVSADNRRTYSQTLPVPLAPPSPPLKRLRQDASRSVPPQQPSLRLDIEQDRYDMGADDRDWEMEEPATGASRTPSVLRPSDEALRDWAESHRDQYLRILLWRDGRGEFTGGCRRCRDESRPAIWRCQECFGGALLCEECLREVHQEHPLHRVESWTGVYFRPRQLKDVGLRVQLGHPLSEPCDRAIPARQDFVVIHDNGIHEVAVDFCGCHRRTDPHHVQLLRTGWYPSTTSSPRTCATLQCLDRFHSLTLQAKITAYDFYQNLESLTDATGVKPPDRYRILLADFARIPTPVTPQAGWSGSRKLWRLGDELGRAGHPLPPPALAQTCAYVMFLALDACFRLKRRMISNEFKDPGLGTGWSYMVEWAPYREHLLKVVDQKEMSTCSGLAALDHANNKFSRGYSVTGVAMGVCARHEFVQPNGVADLQAGERYANMDWVFASILRHLHRRLRMLVSYDIACQWAKNLHERIATLPPMLKLTLVMALLRFALVYSLNLIPGSGQTDGEGIERPWSMIGAVAASTRVSGPGSCADQLDDHWAFWNWKKLIGLAALLRRRLDVAIEEKARQEEAFAIFSAQQQERVPEWKVMVQTFEQNGEAKNPYEPVSKGLTELQVREKFEEEEAEEAASGIPAIHETSSSGFILELLEAEIEQRRIAALVELKKAKSTSMKINLRRSRRRLNRRIATIRTLQATYSPVALQHLASLDLPQETLAEDVPLLPPSALTELQRSNGGCRAGLVELEATFREAQCRSALVSLRNHLHIKSRLLVYKTNQSRNQAANTRSRALVARNESKILLFSRKYQAAWAALVSISGGEAAVSWPRLRKADIRCLEDAEDLSKKDLRQKKAEEKKRRQERELRAAGIIPLVNPNSSMAGGDLDSDDESDDSMSGEGGTARPGRRVVRRPAESSVIQSGESRRMPSWIWTMTGRSGTDEEIEEGPQYFSSFPRSLPTTHPALRIEWAKSWARVRRWTEEVLILEEEWRRLPLSFAFEEQGWIQRAQAVPVTEIPEEDAEGMIAYATKQADVYRNLATRAELTRTVPKLARGHRRARALTFFTSAAEIGTALDEEDGGDGLIERDDEGDEAGNVSDEELVMGGEVDEW
ncbi:hypothetical protein C8F01DRAFT_1332164 [Mycena amicta]|nr:hypothetical protein C8F01DRAFT_1332164 [Mycena amicta]